MVPPTLLVVSGPPGAGKTTLAKALADTLGWPVACRDEIKERMVADEAGPADQLDRMALAAFFERLRVLLRAGSSAIAEAAYQDRLWRPGLKPLTALADVRVIRCVVEPEVARERIALRQAHEPARAAHADAEFLRRIAAGQRPIETWVPISLDLPCLAVRTSPGLTPALDRIVAFATLGTGHRKYDF